MTHERNIEDSPHRHLPPEEDYTLPNATSIPEYRDVEDSLSPLLTEDVIDA